MVTNLPRRAVCNLGDPYVLAENDKMVIGNGLDGAHDFAKNVDAFSGVNTIVASRQHVNDLPYLQLCCVCILAIYPDPDVFRVGDAQAVDEDASEFSDSSNDTSSAYPTIAILFLRVSLSPSAANAAIICLTSSYSAGKSKHAGAGSKPSQKCSASDCGAMRH
jgi:hypothetical protein